MRGELSARHGNEGAVRPLDDFQVSHNEAIVECNRAKPLQAIVRIFHQLDAHFRNLHDDAPLVFARLVR